MRQGRAFHISKPDHQSPLLSPSLSLCVRHLFAACLKSSALFCELIRCLLSDRSQTPSGSRVLFVVLAQHVFEKVIIIYCLPQVFLPKEPENFWPWNWMWVTSKQEFTSVYTHHINLPCLKKPTRRNEASFKKALYNCNKLNFLQDLLLWLNYFLKRILSLFFCKHSFFHPAHLKANHTY